MIEGTRQYKGGKRNNPLAEDAASAAENAANAKNEPRPESSAPSVPFVKVPQEKAPASSDAMNLERREWFHSLLPAFGDGLVKLLRTSNNLQHDLHQTLREKTESFTRPHPTDKKK